MDTVLLFRDAEMQPEPVLGPSLTLAAAKIEAGETVFVRLAPGDGHVYDLLVSRVRQQWLTDSSTGALLVLNVFHTASVRGAVIDRGGRYDVLLEQGAWDSPWQMTVVRWWCEAHLWPRIAVLRGVPEKPTRVDPTRARGYDEASARGGEPD